MYRRRLLRTLLAFCALALVLGSILLTRSDASRLKRGGASGAQVHDAGLPSTWVGPIECGSRVPPSSSAVVPPVGVSVQLEQIKLAHPQQHPKMLTDILRSGYELPDDFDKCTRAWLSEGDRDSLTTAYVFLMRSLVLGPDANADFRPSVSTGSTAVRAYLIGLGARPLRQALTDESLLALCTAVVYGPVVELDKRMHLMRLAAVAMGTDETPIRSAFDHVREPRRLDDVFQFMNTNDPRIVGFVTEHVIDLSDSETIGRSEALLVRPDLPETYKDSLIEKMASGGQAAEDALLQMTARHQLDGHERAAIVFSVLSVSCTERYGIVSTLSTDPDPEVRRAVVQGLASSAEPLLPAALQEAGRVIKSESNPEVRALMIGDMGSNVRMTEVRVSLFMDLATSDPAPACRISALDELAKRGCPTLGGFLDRVSLSDPDEEVRSRARTLSMRR